MEPTERTVPELGMVVEMFRTCSVHGKVRRAHYGWITRLTYRRVRNPDTPPFDQWGVRIRWFPPTCGYCNYAWETYEIDVEYVTRVNLVAEGWREVSFGELKAGDSFCYPRLPDGVYGSYRYSAHRRIYSVRQPEPGWRIYVDGLNEHHVPEDAPVWTEHAGG